MPELRYFVHAGNEKIQLGQAEGLKENPFKDVHTSTPISHYSVELFDEDEGVVASAIGIDSMKQAFDRLRASMSTRQGKARHTAITDGEKLHKAAGGKK